MREDVHLKMMSVRSVGSDELDAHPTVGRFPLDSVQSFQALTWWPEFSNKGPSGFRLNALENEGQGLR